MGDPSQILEALYAAGFELRTFDQFPRAIGVAKGNCIALLERSEKGLRLIGSSGWRLGDAIGVLTSKGGKRVFQAKDQIVEANPERLGELRRFEAEVLGFLQAKPN